MPCPSSMITQPMETTLLLVQPYLMLWFLNQQQFNLFLQSVSCPFNPLPLLPIHSP